MDIRFRVGDTVKFTQDSIASGIGTIEYVRAHHAYCYAVRVHSGRTVAGADIMRDIALHDCDRHITGNAGWWVTDSGVIELLDREEPVDISEDALMEVLHGARKEVSTR